MSSTGGGDIAAFDLGGTWFRSARVSVRGDLGPVHKSPAVSFRNRPDLDCTDLQRSLVLSLKRAVKLRRLKRP